jgi:adenylosuccinate synthase
MFSSNGIGNWLFLQKLNLIQAYKQYQLSVHGNLDDSFEYDINFGILFDRNLNNHDLYHRYKNFYNKVNIVKDYGSSLINSSNYPIFEGNQGILLDDLHGFQPYSTPTKTTSFHAEEILRKIKFKGSIE